MSRLRDLGLIRAKHEPWSLIPGPCFSVPCFPVKPSTPKYLVTPSTEAAFIHRPFAWNYSAKAHKVPAPVKDQAAKTSTAGPISAPSTAA
jgi:hypothetical protein